MEPLDYCSNFLIGGYNSDGSTRLYSLVEEDELLASIRGRIMKKIALINPPFRGVIHRIKDAYPLGLGYMLAPGENRHFEPGENSQFQPGGNRQSVPGGCSQPRFGCGF